MTRVNQLLLFCCGLTAMAATPCFTQASAPFVVGNGFPGQGHPATRTVTSRALAAADRVAGRTSWLFPHGYYREIDPRVWMEQQGRRRRLQETARTRQYVELYDGEQRIFVRLFDHQALQRRAQEKQWHRFYPGHWEDPALLPLNTMKLPNIRGDVDKAAPRAFPHLGQRFEVLGPATPQYNCIAWSLGLTDHWVWPGNHVRDFDLLNQKYGYHKLARLDFTRSPHQDRIVLYGKGRGPGLVPTHQARQLADGSWSSKLGALPLVRHLRPTDLDGEVYGVPIAVYVREHDSNRKNRP